ncbi:RNA polymerase factor sigma-54 [Luminiphilus sp.]|nr:RNA polymerase factor sigma-54 [Luminiphilus sp.]
MKQALQLKLGQQLVLTPQLQQAIKLLQMSTIDLQQTIDETLESNALLEHDTDDSTEDSTESQDVDFSASTPVDEATQDLAVDTTWEDILPSAAPPPSNYQTDAQFAEQDAEERSLQDHLLWQLNLTRFSDIDRVIALALIDAIDTDGRLTQTPEGIQSDLAIDGVDLEEVLAVLHRLQHFEPSGLFAEDLRECLLIQLRQLPPTTPFRDVAGALVSRHLSQLPSTPLRQLAKKLRAEESELEGAMQLIRSLDPTPGASIGDEQTGYVTPDIFVRQHNDRWLVELNPDISPKLRVNEHYVAILSEGSASDRGYAKEHLQEARWFMKSLQSRNETLLKVASKIVEHQRSFLEQGEIGMKPLVLADIASEVDLHESTVSRATTQKYMHTPRGTFELKYFFSSRLTGDDGEDASSTAIKATIRQLVTDEDIRKPLSDAKLCILLKDQGMTVARRTIAKYREQLNIPPSNERKRLN